MPQPKQKPKPKPKPAKPKSKPKPLTVAVTGPTGDIGKAFVRALERSRSVGKVLGMARRPFDPEAQGWRKTEYRQGDVLDRKGVDALVAEADVVVHLAFIIFGGPQETREVNLKGSRNVFEASAASKRTKRLVYASSVAAYGFHDDPTGRSGSPRMSSPGVRTTSTTRPRRPSSRACSRTSSARPRPTRTCSAPASSPARTRCC